MSDYTVKAAGDWELDVLGVPYGGPYNGRDAHGEYFAPDTDLMMQPGDQRPVVYYHGVNPDETALQSTPRMIGKARYTHSDERGAWFRVVLDRTNELAQRVWRAAQEGLARASTGTAAHLKRKTPDGRITSWPVAELSLMDVEGDKRQPANAYAVAMPALKSVYQQAGLTLPDALQNPGEGAEQPEAASPEAVKAAGNVADAGDVGLTGVVSEGVPEMSEIDMQAAVAEAVAAAMKARDDAATAAAERQAEIDAAVKAEAERLRAEFEAEAAKARRLPTGVNVQKHGEVRRYDNLSTADLALMMGITHEARKAGRSAGPSEEAVKALGLRLDSAESGSDDRAVVREVEHALKAADPSIKANELNYSTYSTYGDQFVGVAYSQALWESIRHDAWVAASLPSVEVPAGHESITIPVEGADPSFYKVAQATGLAAATDYAPASTITSSKAGTANQSLTLSKLGARTIYSGELEEDSLIPWAPMLRMKLAKRGAEVLDSVMIDGDTETGATTNINDIGGTPAATDYFLTVNGFRKLALVTNTANARDGGTLTVEDFLETLKLLGASGKYANPQDTMFILSPSVYWKVLELDELKTRDVFSSPTLENGLPRIMWGGYVLRPSWAYGLPGEVNTGYEYKENTAGKIDVNTAANNTKGSFLAVNKSQWLMGWRRRMTMEFTRFASSDSNEIVAQMRFGLVYRDTEASAITYNLTV